MKINTDLPARQFHAWKYLLLAILCAVRTWTYVRRVLIPHQVRYDAARSQPRGNLSDLYPRWLGPGTAPAPSRSLNPRIHARNSSRVLRAPIDSDGHPNRNYDQGFFYPAYVAFFLAPTFHLPFAVVQKGLLGFAQPH